MPEINIEGWQYMNSKGTGQKMGNLEFFYLIPFSSEIKIFILMENNVLFAVLPQSNADVEQNHIGKLCIFCNTVLLLYNCLVGFSFSVILDHSLMIG